MSATNNKIYKQIVLNGRSVKDILLEDFQKNRIPFFMRGGYYYASIHKDRLFHKMIPVCVGIDTYNIVYSYVENMIIPQT